MHTYLDTIKNCNKSNKAITFPIFIIILSDIVIAGLEFGKYYAENTPTSLIIAKVCAAIIKYPSYIGLCLFACNNINSFLFRNAGTMLRPILQKREMTHKLLASQAILAGIGHIISHGFYNPKEFAMPIGISGLFLMPTMVALLVSYMILHRSFLQISESFSKFKQNISHVRFDKTHKMLAIASLFIYLLHIGLPNVDQEWWGVSNNVGDFMKVVSWGMALVVIGDKFYSWLKSDIKKVKLEKLNTDQKETVIVKIPYKLTFNHVPGAFLYIGFSSGNLPKDLRGSLHPFTISYTDEGYLYLTVRPSGPFTKKLAELEEAKLRIFGPYNGPLSSIKKVNTAAVIVAGVGISFANSYLQYLINNQKNDVTLYLIIKQERSNIDLLDKGTLPLIAKLSSIYEKDNLLKKFKIILSISRNNNLEQYNSVVNKLKEQLKKQSTELLDKKIEIPTAAALTSESVTIDMDLKKGVEKQDNMQASSSIHHLSSNGHQGTNLNQPVNYSVNQNNDLTSSQINIEFHNCSSKYRDEYDNYLIDQIVQFDPINPIKDIYYCGMLSWVPSLEAKARKKGISLISEAIGQKNKVKPQGIDCEDKGNFVNSIKLFDLIDVVQNNGENAGDNLLLDKNIEIPQGKINKTLSDYKNLKLLTQDNKWFKGEEMNTLLRIFFVNRLDIRLFDAIDVLQENGEIFRENLIQARDQLLPTQTNIVVPINLSNLHWAGLHINFDRGHNQPPKIYYIDPIGGDMNDILRRTLMEVYPGADIYFSTIRFQSDSYNCGPWTIFLLQKYIQHRSLTNVEDININDIRQLYISILDSIQSQNNEEYYNNSLNIGMNSCYWLSNIHAINQESQQTDLAANHINNIQIERYQDHRLSNSFINFNLAP